MRIRGIVVKVVGPAFEPVLLNELDFLRLLLAHVCRVERFKGLFADALFRPLKDALRGRRLGLLIVSARERLVVHTDRLCAVQASFL
jgi:hypothetical protein